jgi:hypothetical protein
VHCLHLQFTGDPSNYTIVKTWSTTYYNNSAGTLKKYPWTNNAACTTAYQAYCEIPKSVFNCPSSPPPVPPPSPYGAGLCEPCYGAKAALAMAQRLACNAVRQT